VRTILRLNRHGLRAWEAEVVRQTGAFADRLIVECSPAVQACRRMRLPDDYLYVHRSHNQYPPVSVGHVKKSDLLCM
jgi:hypothetical protein